MTTLIRLHLSNNRKLFAQGSVVTWGSFDGVHIGHQQVLAELKQQAKRLQLPSVVLITEPLAKEFFAKDTIPPRLTGFRERFLLLAEQGIDAIVCARFDKNFSNTSADDYLQNIIVNQLGAKHIVLGDDSRFGYQRQGDLALIKSQQEKLGFSVSDIATQQREAMRVSSSRIRTAMQAGEVQIAEELLGHEYWIGGRVVHGEKRGRTLGFPTANINIKRQQSPLLGVFAVLVRHVANGNVYQAVANIGLRPTFGGKFCLLEVHLLEQHLDLYGQHLQVVFKHKIRDEIRFANIEALSEQIHRDIDVAKAFFQNS